MQKIKDFLKKEWEQVSTRAGLFMTAISSVAPLYAKFDERIAYAGFFAGILLIVFREKSDG